MNLYSAMQIVAMSLAMASYLIAWREAGPLVAAAIFWGFLTAWIPLMIANFLQLN
jgi:hypothetical protein